MTDLDQDKTLEGFNATLGDKVKTKKVTCCKCSRRRDLYFVGTEIYCVDDAIRYLVSLVLDPN